MSKEHLNLLLIISLIFLFTRANGVPENSSLTICPSSNCGNGVSIRYPFWLNNTASSPLYCGYPGFGLTCSPNGETIFHLPNDAYYVKRINYSKNTLTLVDIDVTTQTCPRARHNLNLQNHPELDYTPSDLNLTFFFNCSSYPNVYLVPLPCLSSGSNQSYVFPGEIPEWFDWHGRCEESVVVPVTTAAVPNATGLITGFGSAMQAGFELDWGTARDCGVCEDSGGLCGYNTTAEEFLCFCSDGKRGRTCPGSKFNRTRKLIIGFGSFAGGTLICLLFLVFYRRCHNGRLFGLAKSKNLSPSSTPLSRSMPSNPTSEKDIEKGSTYFGVHIFTYDELEEATNNFDSSKELGDGGFGTVYYGKLRDGRVVAVKRLYENNYKRVEQFMNEVKILTCLRHQNLVTLYGCTSRHSRELLLVYEFVPNGTVADHLHGDIAGSLSWPTRMSIAIETASALSYLHASDIIHRDVKTNNILLDNNFRVKVADFGLSRLFPTDVSHVSTAPQGTPGYVDPDYHQCYQLTDKSDVYSFGVVLIELISSKPAVDITRHRHEINLANLAINKIQNHALHELIDPCLGFKSDNAVKKMTTLVAELAFRCLQLEKEMRPSMDEVLTVLREIESEEYRVKAEEVEIPADDVGLLKNTPPPLSPDSVTDWVSQSTTPSASS